MTGLKDRQRLALYVALGLSAGSGLTLDASTAYAHDIPLNADQTGTFVANAAAGDNVVASQPTGGSTPTITDGDIVGSNAANAKDITVTVNSLKAESTGYGRVYAALSTGEISKNHIVYNNDVNGVVNELLAAASNAAATGSSQNLHNNDVKVNTGTIHNDVTGAAGTASADVHENKVFVNNGTIGGNVTGGSGGVSSHVYKNEVSVSDGSIAKQVNGGAGGANATVTGNKVTISGGNLKAVNGGIGKNGSIVNDNTVTITGGTFAAGRIVGGETGATGKATGNRVVLGEKDGTFDSHTDLTNSTLWGSRYAGSGNNGVIASGDARITGTALEVNAQDVKVKRTRNFQTYQFNLNKNLANNATMLTVTEGFGAGANVQWNDIQLDVSGWQDGEHDPNSKYYGKNDLTLLKTSDGTRRLDIVNGTSSLTRTDLSGDFEYLLATDNHADPTAANGAVSVAKVTAAVNRIQNANAVYDATGRPVDADNAVRGGYSEYDHNVTKNTLKVTNLPATGLTAAYGGEVAGRVGSVFGNTLDITGTDDHTSSSPVTRTLTNAYGGAITNANNAANVRDNDASISAGIVTNLYGGYTKGAGTVGGLDENAGNSAMVSGGAVTNLYGGYTAGTGSVQNNDAAVEAGTVDNVYGGAVMNAGSAGTVGGEDEYAGNTAEVNGGTVTNLYGGYTLGRGGVENNEVEVNGGTVTNAYGGASDGSGAVKDNEVTLLSGTVVNAYGGNAAGSGKAIGNSVEVDGATVTGSIYGAETTSGNVSGSHVFITGGTIGRPAAGSTSAVLGSVMGAQSADGNVDGNSVTITGGTIVGTVYGGGATGSGNVTNNAVNLGNEDNHNLRNANLAAADLIGSIKGTGTASGNALNVYAKNANVHTVSAFDTHHFILDRAITDGATMLSIAEGGFGREIDWNSVVVEKEPTMMKDGNPGGRVILAKGTASDKLKIAGYAKRDMSVDNIEHVVEMENPTETSTGHFEAEKLLLTYAKFKDNKWTYGGADSSPTSESNEVFGGISYLADDTTEKNELTVTGVPTAGLTAVYGGQTNGDANSKNNFVLVQGTDQYGSNPVVHSTIPNVYGGYTAANYRTETIANTIVDKAGVAEGNTATISGGNVTSVYGGVAKGDKGKVRSNKAIVGGGSVANVYGGAVDKADAAATKNTAQVSGGTVTGTIAGARAVYDTAAGAMHTLSNGNRVILGGENATRALPMDVALASIYGTDYRDPSVASPEQTFNGGSDQIKDNELIVRTTGVSAKKVRNFDAYTYVVGKDFKDGDTMLTLTDAGFGDVTSASSATPVRVDWRNVKAHMGEPLVASGEGIHGHNDKITLMKLGTGVPTTDALRFAHYEDTDTAEVEGIYEMKVKPATGYTTSSPAGSSSATDLDTSAVMLELNRFRFDEVTYDGTAVPSDHKVYGGYSGYDDTAVDVNGIHLGHTTADNVLNITGTHRTADNITAYGGYAEGAHGGAVDNSVRVDVQNASSAALNSVYGGYAKGANAGAVSGNTVTFSQGATLHDLMGGYIDSATSTSDVSGNQVFIAGGEFNNAVATDPAPRIYGGATDGSGMATRNVLQITGGTIGNATHAADVIGGRSATGAAVENHVLLGAAEPGATPTAPTLKGNVTGGYGATATDNTVEILAGTLDGSVYGGYATTAGTPATTGASPTAEVSALRNNKVTLRDGVTVTGNVYGAYAAADASNMTAATDSNTIDLYKAVIDGTIYGGMAKDTTGNDVVSGKNNTLAVYARGAKADDFVGVQNLHFYVPAGTTAADQETMLTLDNVAGATATTPTTKDLSHVNVGVKLAGNRPSLKVGDAVSLMKVYEGNTIDATHAVAITSDTPLVNKTTGMQGVSLRYNFDLLTREAEAGSGKNNELYATVTSASVNPDTKSLAETRAASLAFLTSGSDLLTDAAMTAAMEVAATPASESQAGRARVDGAPKEYRMWAVQNVSSMRLNSGSHVDAKGWGLNLGFAKQRVAGRNTLTYGPFVEYGKGSYDSYLDDGLHGSGNMDYLGVGVMAKSQSENGSYVEGSVRVGRVKSDYAGTIDNTHTTYDSSSTYYAGHLGVGQEKQLKNGNVIDTYAKYFFTHQGGDTAKLSTGEVYDFDAADSHRIRFGTRYTSKKGDASFYTGLAYEYEFGNDIAASFEGYHTPSPSLTGGTGILELGYRFTPQNGRATYGIQLMGMTGKRRGISGGVQMHWAF